MRLLKPAFGQQLKHPIRLVVTMLQQQPAAGLQVSWRLFDDLPDVVQPVGACRQGLQRLMRQGNQVRVGIGDIRRVACD